MNLFQEAVHKARADFDLRVATLCKNAGIKINDIAQQLGVSRTMVERSLRRQGISRKPGRPRRERN